MSSIKQLLEEKKRIKSRKPVFLRSDGHKKAKVPKKWRTPRGIQNKMRREKRGFRRVVKYGWGSPASVRGMDSAGLMLVRVSTLAEMRALDPKKNCAIIAGSVGLKRTIALLAEAKSKGVKVMNISDENVKKRVSARDAARAASSAERSAKAKKSKETEKKAEKQADEKAVDEDPEDKKRKEKEERDRVITKREQ